MRRGHGSGTRPVACGPVAEPISFPAMNAAAEKSPAERERRLVLARKAFEEFHALCFWSCRDEIEITEETIPFIVQGLRESGGHKGYRIAAELCR